MMDDATQETSILETFSAVLKTMPPDHRLTFWDVGANIGLYTWQCALARPDSQIVSFEPDPRNLRCLERTSGAWALSHHTIMATAVAEKSGRAGFCVDELAGATGTLQCDEESFNQRHYGMAPRRIEVETIALDDFMRDRPPPDIIKIDVEGAELRVLRGAARLLAQHRPVLFFESFEHGADILEQLRPLGYVAWDTDERSEITRGTVNFIAFVPEVRPAAGAALAHLAYPIPRAHEIAQ
jgi:FkbM family methyltransferase